MTTKALVKAQYIAHLQDTYTIYTEGSQALKTANMAVDAALRGELKLRGECWDKALKDCGLPKTVTLKTLAALPER